MFEKFTQQARRVIVTAEQQAGQLHHPFIGTEHLLLGLLGVEGTIAYEALRDKINIEQARSAILEKRGPSQPTRAGIVEPTEALAAIGIDLESIRRNAEQSFGPGALRLHRVPFSPAAKRVLEFSLREALILSDFYIGPEHLLLGVIEEGGRAVEVLTALGVDPDELRSGVVSRAAPAAERIRAANAGIGRLGAELTSLDHPNQREIADALYKLRRDAGAAYENASEQSRRIQEHLADQLEQVLAAASTIKPPAPPSCFAS